MEGLVRYYAAEASLAAEGLVGPAQGEWLDRVRDDLENYRGALTWLIDRDRPAEASDIAWSLFFFWGIRGHAAEGIRWYEQILSGPHFCRLSNRERCSDRERCGTRKENSGTPAPRSRAPSRSLTRPTTW